MKTFIFISLILFVFIFSIFSVCYGTNRTYNFQSFNKADKAFNLKTFSSNTTKTIKFQLQDHSETVIGLMESALFITGLVLYCRYDYGDPAQYHYDSYLNTSLILMGISIGGGFISVLSSSDFSGNNYYGPRSSVEKRQNVQLSLNGQGLGLRMNF